MDGALAGHLGEVLIRYIHIMVHNFRSNQALLYNIMLACCGCSVKVVLCFHRCNNVLYIRGVEEEEEDGEMRE